VIKFFLVEDEIVIRESIRQMVPWNDYGFELTGEASDGEMALPLIRKLKPDVLITDIRMPFMDGLVLSRIVRRELPETKIIIVSGYEEFFYAKQAIELGVEQYLLKPIDRNGMIEVLKELRGKFDRENEQRAYYNQFMREVQEYEKHSRRDFFELLIYRNFDLEEIYEKAEQLHINIEAQCYNIVLFSMEGKHTPHGQTDSYSEELAQIQSGIDECFQDQKQYLIFRNQIFNYALLIKGDTNTIEEHTNQAVERLKEIFKQGGENVEWFICTGKPVNRVSQISECYKAAMRVHVLRYLEPSV